MAVGTRFSCACFVLLLSAANVLAAAPIAPMLVVTVPKNTEVIVTLSGYDSDGDQLTAKVTSVVASGTLNQLSQIFSVHGYTPRTGTAIASASAASPVTVTGSSNRLLYTPPKNTNPPTEKWAMFTYTVSDATSTSEPGIVWLLPEARVMESSTFSWGNEGWSVETNGARAAAMTLGGVTHEPYSRGSLMNHYIQSTDAEIHTDRVTNDDMSRWRFVAPSKFLGNQVVSYGGSLSFNMASAAGDFSADKRNSNAKVVELKCDTCDSGRGITLVRWADSTLVLDGKTKAVNIPLVESAWRKDPKNSLLTWSAPSQCDMVEVLSGLTKVSILGDHTQWYESVAIDSVTYTAGTSVPVACASIYY